MLRESIRSGKRRPLLVLPTGGGKTIIFNEIARKAKGNVLILVHRKELLEQTASKYGGDIGRVEPNKPTPSSRVIVAMVATVVNRLDQIPTPSVIIIDEAHHANATTYQRIINRFDAFVVGVTATPCRADGSGLIDTFDDLIIGATMPELVEQGFLIKPTVFAPKEIDMSSVRIVLGDFDKQQAIELINNATITGDVIKHYEQLAPNQTAVVFCISVQHAHDVARIFSEHGYSAAALDGNTPKEKRDEVIRNFGKSIRILASCDLISEGFDVPNIGAAILLRPTQSKSLYLQQVGRALRLSEGKTRAVILDHVGNTRRHGHPMEEQNWTLDAPKRKGRISTDETKTAQCKECYAIYNGLLRSCPECGHEPEVDRSRKIDEVDGELVEIEAKQKRFEVAKARSLEQLRKIAEQRGYKRGWAEHVYRSRKR